MNRLNNNNERCSHTDFGGHFCRSVGVEIKSYLAHCA